MNGREYQGYPRNREPQHVPQKGRERGVLLEPEGSYLATILLEPSGRKNLFRFPVSAVDQAWQDFPSESRGPHQDLKPLVCTNHALGEQTDRQTGL